MAAPALLRLKRALSILRERLGRTVLLVLAFSLLLLWPVLWTEIGTRRAARCLAAWRAPRTSAPATCGGEISWFVTPSKLPWTRTAASYRAEEVSAREAVEAYLDAAIGRPDRAALGRTGEVLERYQLSMRHGSQRVELQELGPAVTAPDLGYYAYLTGDRGTLVKKAESWTAFKVRQRALEAALEAGQDARAVAIAEHYAGLDPHDDELRMAVAATLCLDGDAKQGLALLEYMQTERSSIRHESFSRDFGDVRLLILACAAKAGVPPLEAPREPAAGQLDEVEPRAVYRLRRLAGRASDDPHLREAAEGAVGVLVATEHPVAYRALLAGAVVASGFSMTGEEVAAIARVKQKEPPLAPTFTSAYDWLEERRGVVALPGQAALLKAAKRVAELAVAAGAPSLRADLGAFQRALRLEAARAAVSEQDEAGALAVIDGPDSPFPTVAARRLARATALHAMGDRERALLEISAPSEASTRADDKRALVVRAELLASLGRRAEAGPVAEQADALGATDDADIDVRARWVRAALSKSALRTPVSVDPGDLALRLAWPSIALFGSTTPWIAPEVEAAGDLDRALAMWDAARAATPADKLPIRYAVFARRGEAPRARVPFLDLAATLLPPGGGDVEIWLDAFFAIDGRALPMRTNAWVRAEAARARGDAAAAARWDDRAAHLRAAFVAQPEIASILGI